MKDGHVEAKRESVMNKSKGRQAGILMMEEEMDINRSETEY